MTRCIRELERIYGIRNGGDRKSNQNNLGLKTQSNLVDELGMGFINDVLIVLRIIKTTKLM